VSEMFELVVQATEGATETFSSRNFQCLRKSKAIVMMYVHCGEDNLPSSSLQEREEGLVNHTN
jgi:hypothetical protein